MQRMKEFYEKVASDKDLLNKFAAITADAEGAGKEATEVKLIAFAKEAGYDISIEEMQAYFTEKSRETDGQLSDAELDMVAGGKSANGFANTVMSVITVGVWCAMKSAITATLNAISSEIPSCPDTFK